jgi:hypothetical protein
VPVEAVLVDSECHARFQGGGFIAFFPRAIPFTSVIVLACFGVSFAAREALVGSKSGIAREFFFTLALAAVRCFFGKHGHAERLSQWAMSPHVGSFRRFA